MFKEVWTLSGIFQKFKELLTPAPLENVKKGSDPLCFDNGLYNACANRAYYSALQAAVAALAHRGIKRDGIDHKWVQADFSGRLIRRQKAYPGRLKSYLSDMQFVRDKADCTNENVSRKIAGRWLSKLKELLELIEKEISK